MYFKVSNNGSSCAENNSLESLRQENLCERENDCLGLLSALSRVPEWVKEVITLNVKAIFVIIRCCADTFKMQTDFRGRKTQTPRAIKRS